MNFTMFFSKRKAWQRLVCSLLCILSCTFGALAQQKIQGKVYDETGSPIVGANVFERGTTNAVSTDLDGSFSLSLKSGATLEVSYIGYLTEQILITNQTVFNITLKVDQKALEELVVIGYGTVKKKDLTGAVSVINTDALRDRNSQDIAGSLQGLASGVRVTSGGLPGQQAIVRIRGLGSLTNNSPLFIVDGMIGGEAHLNPADVESIQVLKDASAAAIYGSRAANGVIIITTKKGADGPMKVQFDANVTITDLPRYDLMDATTWKKYNDLAYDEAIRSGVPGVLRRQNHFDGNTDWQDEMLSTGVLQNYNLSLSGGSKSGNYFVAFNRMVDDGALYGTGYDRYGFRVNTSGRKGIFSFGENIAFTKTTRKNLNGNPWANFIGISPTIPVRDAGNPGGYGYGSPDRANNYGLNMVAMQDLRPQDNPESILKANVYGQVDIFKDFNAKLNLAYTNYSGVTNTLRKSGNWTMGQGNDPSSLGFENYRSEDILIEQTFNYKKAIGKHDIDAVAGATYNSFLGRMNWITKLDPLRMGDEYITSLDAATGITSAGGSYQQARIMSYLGRVNYSYDDKYLLQATFRRDGTSRLPTATRWGNFSSFSAAWRISNESFFDVPFIDDLKIRASHGTLGNSSIGYWDYQAVINNAPRAVFGSPELVVMGMTQSRLTNTDLVWERKSTTNIGFDAALLNNKLTVSAEYFKSSSKDLLVYLPILMSSGNEGGNPAVNAGSLTNNGLELELGWRDNLTKDFSYSASMNLSRIRNKVTDLGYGRTEYYEFLSKTEIGQPLGAFYLFKTLGIFQNEAEIQNHKSSSGKVIQPNARPGDIKYDDFNDDGIISSEDRQLVGNPWPKFELGINLGASYKSFDISINGYGRFGQDVWNGAAAAAADFANNQNNFNGIIPWTAENPVNDRPRIVFGDTRNSRGDQDRWLEKGSFFRLSQVALGYTIPTKWSGTLGLERVRAGVTLQNLVTFTKYSGLDPEFRDGGIFTLGSDNMSFPNPRSVMFSLSVNF